jgi:hypothetical protein
MSSSIALKFDQPVSGVAWSDFCRQHAITFSPNTIGQSTFYHGGVCRVEIALGERGSVERGPDGRPNWSTARPPETFTTMYVSSFFGQNLSAIGALVREIAAEFPCEVCAAPELENTVVDLPHAYEPRDNYDETEILPTDDEGAWTRDGDTLTTKVSAGIATIRQDGELAALEVDGVLRGNFRKVSSAMAFAGRCNWDWWRGPTPGTPEDNETISPVFR